MSNTKLNRRPVWPAYLLTLACAVLALAAQPSFAQDATLGPGDVVRVSVYGQADLQTTTSLSADGNISFPLLGTIAIGGLTTREAEEAIGAELARRNLVRDPQVTVFLERSRAAETDLVTILGHVNRPGRYPARATTDADPVNVASLVALAGGLTEKGGEELILTRRIDGEQRSVRVDLRALLEEGDLEQNHELVQGDIAYVPEMKEFFVYGEVRNPGIYRLRPGMTVIQGLSASGGLTARGSDKGISVTRRRANGSLGRVKVELNDRLRPDDVLIVREGLF